MFSIVFVLFIIAFIVILIKNISQWAHNNAQPQIPAEAAVVAKRIVSHHHNHEGHMHVTHSYLVTFEYTNGQQIEATVKRGIYDDVREFDRGILTMQGTRFISFERW